MDNNTLLNLPNTKFPMKANLVKNELTILKKWNKLNLYKLLKHKYQSNNLFCLHDGPPYANGNIHLGHALNKILKDIIIKFKSLNNYNIQFIPGWDCHGLPIELKIEERLKKKYNINSKKNVDNVLFKKLCKNYAIKQVNLQKKNFIRLGIIADWNNSYLTMDLQTNTLKLLSKLIKLNYIYRDIKPVYWCSNCTSSLAEAEIEYKLKNTLTAYILFELDNNSIIQNSYFSKFCYNIKTYILIWTTTIWTLPANQAIAINPNFNYVIVLCNNKFNLIIEQKLFLKLKNTLLINQLQEIKILANNIKGNLFKYLKYIHVFNNQLLPIIFNKNINNEEGTGIVHIAPAYGVEDNELCKQHNIIPMNLINRYGTFYSKSMVPLFLQGININTSHTLILKFLKNKQLVLNTLKINHKYPYCWRHNIPVIFRSTPQWFINLNKNQLKQQCIKNIHKINWLPSWGKEKMIQMINLRPDWCISRQRIWGTPLPLLIHKKTNVLHPRINNLINSFIKYNQHENWMLNLNKHKFLIKENLIQYKTVLDILDVWFDSGATFYTVNKSKFIDLFVEGVDQYRGWFMSSLILSTIINGNPPCRQIITHGFVVDENKKKMSKSLINSLSPNKIVNKYGADILRLWIASNNFTHEISISDNQLNNVSISYRRIRNTVRYIIANLNDFNYLTNSINLENLLFLDKWIIYKTIKLNQQIINLYNNYKFHEIIKHIINFCTKDLGSFYLDIIKDRLYTLSQNSLGRRSCQTTLWNILNYLIRWIAPILSFTAEEIWEYISKNKCSSIYLQTWCNLNLKKLKLNEKFLKIWLILNKLKHEFNKQFEIYKNELQLNSSLEVNLIILLPSSLIKQLNYLISELHFYFITSKVKLLDNNLDQELIHVNNLWGQNNNIKFIMNKSNGRKCQRCWHYKISTTRNNKFNFDICSRCIINLNKGETRLYF